MSRFSVRVGLRIQCRVMIESGLDLWFVFNDRVRASFKFMVAVKCG